MLESSLRKTSIVALFTIFTIMAASSTARADIGTVFTYGENGGGYFQYVGAGNWVEFVNNDGGVMFNFREVSRTKDSVLLYDASRVIWIRIFTTTSSIRHSGTGGWVFLYNGRWS